MDWKVCAIDDLRRYKHMKIGILNARDRLRMLLASARSAKTNAATLGNHTNSQLVDTIVETERLQESVATAEGLIALIDRGLSSLAENERHILEKFYISDVPVNIEKLKEELGYEQRSIYRLRDRALLKFTLAMYGVEIS